MKLILGLCLILSAPVPTRAEEHAPEGSQIHAPEGSQTHAPEGSHLGGHNAVAELGGAGPAKGVLTANEKDGFMPSQSVRERFGVVVMPATGPGPWRVGRAAILLSLDEKNIYRERGGFFRRVDFTEVGEAGSDLLVKSADLRAGDGIAVGGIGFLRAIELTVFAKEPAGHAH